MQMQPVNMVSDFCWKKVSTKLLLQHQAMLKHQPGLPSMGVPVGRKNKSVAVKVNNPTGAVAVV